MSARRIETHLLEDLADAANEVLRVRLELADATTRDAIDQLRDELEEQVTIVLYSIDNVVLLDQGLLDEATSV